MYRKLQNNDELIKEVYTELGENSVLPIHWLSAEGQIIYVNNATCEQWGYEKSELLGMYIFDIDPIFQKEKFAETFAKLIDIRVIKIPTKHKKKSGELIDVEVIATLCHLGGKPISVSYVFDITENIRQEKQIKELNDNLEKIVASRTEELQRQIKALQETEEKLLLTERKYTAAIQTTQDAVAITRVSDGMYIDINQGFTNISGYEPEEIIGKTAKEINIWHDYEARDFLISELKKHGVYRNMDTKYIGKGGKIIHGLMSASLQEMNGETVLLSVTKDIGDIKKIEQELKELNNNLQLKVEEEVALRQRQEAIVFAQKKLADMGQMINSIAHQWRQPINGLGLLVQLFAAESRSNQVTPEKINEFEKESMKMIIHLSDTIDQFRKFFSPDKEKALFNVVQTISFAMDLVRAQLASKLISLHMTYNSDKVNTNELPVILIDSYEGEFKQALLNIIYNATDAIVSNDMGGNIFIDITEIDDKVTIAISDTGGGVEMNIINRIFDPFFSTKKHADGTGIGLYMSKTIIEKHMNGRLTADNTKEGAVFTIELPLEGKNADRL
jgi:PAS domain S-box-containing protein